MIVNQHFPVRCGQAAARQTRPAPARERGIESPIEEGVPETWTERPPMPMPSAFTPSNTVGRFWTGVGSRRARASIVLDRRRQPMRDLRGVARGDRQEGAEVEVARTAREVAEAAHVDERDVAA